MSRRFILLIIVMIAMLYFSIIIFMLNPLHSREADAYIVKKFGFKKAPPTVQWCKDLLWQLPTRFPVALVSHPGSGNTWLRYLLQQVTGYVTGSVYMDYGLKAHGFPAENVTDGTVIVVKTHELPPRDLNTFKSAILLIRNPRDALLADFNRLHKGHTGTAPKSAFKAKAHENKKADWSDYVWKQLKAWEVLHREWLHNFKGRIHIVFYENLVKDTKSSLLGILDFLDHKVTEDDMNCALRNREGIYRRRRKIKDFDPYNEDMSRGLKRASMLINIYVENYYRNNPH